MQYLTILTSFFGISSKTLIIRAILLAIITAFSTYFYFDYQSLKESKVELKSKNLFLEDTLKKVEEDREKLQDYYQKALNDCENTYNIVSKIDKEDKEIKQTFIKKVKNTDTLSGFFDILRED